MMRTADEVVSTARGCIGWRWKHQGRGERPSKVAVPYVDCIGLIIWVLRELGLPYHDPAPYKRFPTGNFIIELLDRHAEPVSGLGRQDPPDSPDAAMPGMVAVFWIMGAKEPQHLAFTSRLETGQNAIIHADIRRRVCEQPMSDLWGERLIKLYRIRGVKYPE